MLITLTTLALVLALYVLSLKRQIKRLIRIQGMNKAVIGALREEISDLELSLTRERLVMKKFFSKANSND